ncbi:MAG: type II toxin-antitoxin system RelE/ParE family toxin [Planctomycetes bacterium]|nr:type II toxin-antitoxin system RelE/ParE family toxin [Planctomycetota bacterium]
MTPGSREPHFTAPARQDATHAFAWYEEQSLGLGLEFLRCLEAAVLSIQRHPFMYPAVLDEFRQALIRRFPYVVFYEVEPNRIVIHAIFHCSQDPDKWKARLEQ